MSVLSHGTCFDQAEITKVNISFWGDTIQPDWLPKIRGYEIVLVTKEQIQSPVPPISYYDISLEPRRKSVHVTVQLFSSDRPKSPEVILEYSYRRVGRNGAARLVGVWASLTYQGPHNKSLNRSCRLRASHQTDSVLRWARITGGNPVNSTVMLPETNMAESTVSEATKQALVRSVSKNGDFFLAEAELDALSGSLTDAEVIALYEYIRDNSMRLEEEWRDEFIDAFPEQERLLPQPLV